MSVKRFGQFVSESINSDHINYYAFDIDDNIINMPTVIHMDKLIGNKWMPVDVTTSEFSDIRGYSNWRILNNNPLEAFSEFRDDGNRGDKAFITDLKKAISNKSLGPAWGDFIECLTNGSIFALITARGHESKSMRKGIEWLLDNVLSEQQLYEMYNNLQKFVYIFKEEGDFDRILRDKPSKNKLVKAYLDKCDFIGISSPSRGGIPDNPEEEKEKALLEFKKKINNFAASVGRKAKIGFSDDDLKNIKHIENLFDNINKEEFPHIIEYVIKNTKNPNNIITKKITKESIDPMSQSVVPFTKFGSMTSQLQPDSQYNRQDPFFHQHVKRTKHLSEITDEIIKDKKKKKKSIIDKKTSK